MPRAVGEVAQQPAHPVDALGVEAVGRLVEDQHAAGRRAARGRCPSRWRMPSEYCADALACAACLSSPTRSSSSPTCDGRDAEHLCGRRRAPRGRCGRRAGRTRRAARRRGGPGCRACGTGCPRTVARPGGRRREAADHPQGGGLAGAVRAEEAGDGAGLAGERDVVDGGLGAVALGEVVDGDHAAQHRRARPGTRLSADGRCAYRPRSMRGTDFGRLSLARARRLRLPAWTSTSSTRACCPAVLVPERRAAREARRRATGSSTSLCFLLALLDRAAARHRATRTTDEHDRAAEWFVGVDVRARASPRAVAVVAAPLAARRSRSLLDAARGRSRRPARRGGRSCCSPSRCTGRSGRSRRSPRWRSPMPADLPGDLPGAASSPYWVNVVLSVRWSSSRSCSRGACSSAPGGSSCVSLRDRAERAETEQQLRVEQARALERARIAREMHDVLAHRISLLSLHAGALEFRPGRAAGGGRARGGRDPSQRAPGAGGPARGDRRAARRRRTATTPERAAADARRPAGADRRVARRRACACASSWRVAAGGVVPEATGPQRVPDRAGGADQRAQARARRRRSTSTVDGAPGDGLTIEIRNRLPVGARRRRRRSRAPAPGIVGLAERATLAGGRLEHGRTEAGDFRLWAWLPWPT